MYFINNRPSGNLLLVTMFCTVSQAPGMYNLIFYFNVYFDFSSLLYFDGVENWLHSDFKCAITTLAFKSS